MLISPPFLPQRTASGPDDPWLTQAMKTGGFGDGAYPLGADLAWHGGVHLEAPRDGQKRLPVCAIADGTVMYVRKPTAMPAAQADIDKHPLGYGGGWSDDGCVVIRHETEIGEDVTVCYYSITLHMKRIASGVTQGQKIWRKDELGEAGSIYGKSGRIHFEIVCDDTNLSALMGRNTGTLDATQHGRTNTLFGEVHLRLPAGTPFYSAIPLPPKRAGNTAQPQPAWSSTAALTASVGLSRAGQPQWTTRTDDGRSVATAPTTTDVELYAQAIDQAKAHGAVGRDIYELLRFGRILDPQGTNTHALANWQQVAYPGGTGWVDLRRAGVYAFSDADFPDWCGWQLIDDDADSDSRCDSSSLIDLVLHDDKTGSAQQRRTKALGKAGASDVQKRLARTVCLFPSEWEKASIQARWQWLTQTTPPGAGMMAGPHLKPEDFPRFKAHAEALCFWEDANLGIPAKHWHFHPREFVRVFRQCGWLSRDEMFQLFPKTAMRKSGGGWVSEHVGVRKSKVANYYVDLNKVCRRYGITTPLRMAAFYANAMQETMWFSTLHEDNSATRYWPWDGRGFLQLTWPNNYIKYWRFVGKSVDDDLSKKLDAAQRKADNERSSAPLQALETEVAAASMKSWRDDVGGKASVAADSAGAYWAWSYASQYADMKSVNQSAAKPAIGAGSHTYYTSVGMGNVAATVNVGHPSTRYASVNGVVARLQAYNTCEVVLLDTPIFPGSSKPDEPKDYKPRRP